MSRRVHPFIARHILTRKKGMTQDREVSSMYLKKDKSLPIGTNVIAQSTCLPFTAVTTTLALVPLF